jgi:iron complex outermembrane recepter protein
VLKSSCKKLLLASVSVGVLMAMDTPAAVAQDDDQFVIEEVIVTARRKSERLQDVPGTVTAITQSELQSAGVERAADFIAMTPGVSMVDAAEVGDTQVNIRGINGARDAENSFALIIDGVLYTNPAAFNREYTNLQQIEIFKGPQGAIYGRNAAAGAILVTTERPDDEFDLDATFNIAGDSTYLFKGLVSGAVVPNELYVSVGGDYRKSDGFYRNSFQGNAPIVDRFKGYNVHGRLIWEGTDNLSVDMRARYGKVDAASITFNSTFNLPVFATATNTPTAFQDVNDFDFLFQSNVDSDNDQTAAELAAKFDYDADGVTVTGWMLYSDIKNNLISDGTSAAFGFYAGDAACQASVTALTGTPLLGPQFIGQTPVGVIFDPNGSFLGAYTPTTCDGIQEQVRNQRDFSAELRIASDNDSDVQWMSGAYFLDIGRQVGVSLNRDGGAAPIRGLYQATGANATASLTNDNFDSQVFALFGQLEYNVSQDFEMSLALRYDNEKRNVSSLVPFGATQSVIDLNFDGVFNDPLNPALSSLINTSGAIPDKQRTFSAFEPKIAMTYDLTEDTTLYASWGKGFKAGGFNNSGSAATVDIFINGFINGGIGINFADDLGVPLPIIKDDFEKETSSAFEVGFRADLFDNHVQLNAAAYHTSVTDMQFFEFLVGSFGLLRVVSNLDKVDITGVEGSATIHVNEYFRFYASGNWLDSEIKANRSRPDTVGNVAPYTPKYTLNFAADADYPISSTLSVFARADARLIGETWFHTVQGGQRPTIFMPLFELGFGAGAGGLGIADFSNAKRNAYSIIDLRGGVGGEGWRLTAYVNNLTDEKYLEEVIPAPEFGGSFDHPGSRRRIGVDLTITF